MSSCDFRASMWYQRVAPWHVCSAGLEYKLDFGSDDNFARLCTRGPAIVEPACVRARVCSADDERSDAAAVASRIRSAAEANKADEVEYAIRTCFASARICAPSLESAAKNGFADVASVLLDAGVPGDVLLPERRGKRPLHIACEQGHEAVARLIIEALPSAVDDRDDRGFTPLEIARRSDMGGMARRLDALCASLAAKSRVGEAGDGAGADADADAPSRVTIFGYGSLMSAASARRTMPSAEHHRLGVLRDYSRVFSLVSLSNLKRRGAESAAAALASRELAAVALRPHPGARTVGALFDVDANEISAYKIRERRYAFTTVQVDAFDASAGASAGRTRVVNALVCVESTDAAYRAKGTAAEDYAGCTYAGELWGRSDVLPVPSYVELCVAAARELGGDAERSLLDDTLLADGHTTLRVHLAGG